MPLSKSTPANVETENLSPPKRIQTEYRQISLRSLPKAGSPLNRSHRRSYEVHLSEQGTGTPGQPSAGLITLARQDPDLSVGRAIHCMRHRTHGRLGDRGQETVNQTEPVGALGPLGA